MTVICSDDVQVQPFTTASLPEAHPLAAPARTSRARRIGNRIGIATAVAASLLGAAHLLDRPHRATAPSAMTALPSWAGPVAPGEVVIAGVVTGEWQTSSGRTVVQLATQAGSTRPGVGNAVAVADYGAQARCAGGRPTTLAQLAAGTVLALHGRPLADRQARMLGAPAPAFFVTAAYLACTPAPAHRVR